jgi:hypothetical protein
MLKEEEAAEDGQGEGGVLDGEEWMQAAARAQRFGFAPAAGGQQPGLDEEGGADPDGQKGEMNGLKGAVQEAAGPLGALLEEEDVADVHPGDEDLADDVLDVAAFRHRALHFEDEADRVRVEDGAVHVGVILGRDLLDPDPDHQARLASHAGLLVVVVSVLPSQGGHSHLITVGVRDPP